MPLASNAKETFNYDEGKVPEYSLPPVLQSHAGHEITKAVDWTRIRRPEVLALFEEHMYGKTPEKKWAIRHKELRRNDSALGGNIIQREIRVFFTDRDERPYMDILVHQPKTDGAVPVFVGLNFHGNHATTADPDVTLSDAWMRSSSKNHNVNHRATEKSRGTAASRWPAELITSRGYAVATIYCGDLDPDMHDGYKNGIHPLFERSERGNEWTTIGAWAWGLSRALDVFEDDSTLDASRVAVIGHSRLGKTSLWAGAQDERFGLVISNNSGCGGAALSRRAFGETVKRINTSFPHWFCDNFKKYNGKEGDCPVDQHMLISLMAPRPVYVASAEGDRWADPRGEFLSCVGADPVYKLLGTDGLPSHEFPAVNTPMHGRIGYHLRTGKHDINEYDWVQYLDFADKQWR